MQQKDKQCSEHIEMYNSNEFKRVRLVLLIKCFKEAGWLTNWPSNFPLVICDLYSYIL